MKKKIIIIVLLLIVGLIVYKNIMKKEDKIDNNKLLLQYHFDKMSDKEDADNDGLSNKKEFELSTNYLLSDTDMDGLIDSEEVNTYHTDPLKVDTDDDGLTDYNEIKLGLDPLKKDTDGNGIIDSEEKREYTFEEMGVALTVNGSGNIADTYVIVETDTLYSKLEGALNREYQFYSKGNVESITARFYYTDEELDSIYADIETLEVYQVNKNDFNDFKVLKKEEDERNHSIIVRLGNVDQNFYVLGDGKQLYYNGGGSKEDIIKDNLILLADSGFDVGKNGFSFSNYVSNYSKEGHCFGMSIFADLYYQKKLSLKESAKKINYSMNISFEGVGRTLFDSLGIKDDYKASYAYDLTKTSLKDYSPLYNYKLSYDIKNGIKEDKLQSNSTGDKEVLNAIYQMHTMQTIIPMISSRNSDISSSINCAFSQTKICYRDGRVAIQTLESRLKNHEASPFAYYPGGGGHTVNAIRLYRYSNDPNKYLLVYYNNSHPGKEESMDIICSKAGCIADNNHGSLAIDVVRSTTDELDAFKAETTIQNVMGTSQFINQ